MAAALGDEQHIFDPSGFEDAVERLQDARSGADRIKKIVRSLGTFSRVESVDISPVDIQRSIEHAITMGFNELKYRARLVKDFARIPMVLASEGKLAQVFLNLLINAAHAIDEGRADQNEVRVRTRSEGNAVIAEISDTGRGVDPEYRDRIFEPFVTTKGVGVGSGLGLSICKNIVEDFGGTISFVSEANKGTTFRISLPRMPSDWTGGAKEQSDAQPLLSSARGRILVVDDEERMRLAIVRMLKQNHDVLVAASGNEARALLTQDKRFDIIFCDLMMPEMSGMELHAWLAKEDARLAEQVVFITGGAFTPGASAYLAKVGNQRLEKPFDTTSFKKMTHELVLAAKSKRGA